MGTRDSLNVGTTRWGRIGAWALLGSSVLAVTVIVASSLNPDYYYLRSAEARRAFVPDPWDVVLAFVLSAGEAAVLFSILYVGTRGSVALRLLLAWIVFVPWVFVVWEQVGTHVPGFVMFNALWVGLIVMFLTGALLVSAAIQIWRRVGSETRRPRVV